jgi:diaphanous 1
MLARLKMSPAKIKKAILEVDDEVLGVDDLATLGRMLPTPDEVCLKAILCIVAECYQIERLKSLEGDLTKLAKPDLYFREVCP